MHQLREPKELSAVLTPAHPQLEGSERLVDLSVLLVHRLVGRCLVFDHLVATLITSF